MQLNPVPEEQKGEISNVIYIENEELLESADESQGFSTGDSALKNQPEGAKTNNRY